MPSDFSFQVEVDLIVPDFMDASIPLQQIGDTVVEDCKRNIRMATDFETGAQFTPLAKKTNRDKKREVGFTGRPLFRKGIMYNAIHAYKAGKNSVEVGIIPRGNPSRDLIGLIHQEEGVNQHTRIIRRFMGVSPVRWEWIQARMQRWVNERIQKAAHKKLNLKY